MSTMLRYETVITRKPHRCFGCAKQYPAKTEMISAAYADGGTAFGCYWCDTCAEYMYEHFEDGEGCEYGEIYKNDPIGWECLRNLEVTP